MLDKEKTVGILHYRAEICKFAENTPDLSLCTVRKYENALLLIHYVNKLFMKKALISFICFLVLGVLGAKAEGESYLHIRTSTGWSVISLDEVDKLTFPPGSMVASTASGETLDTFERGALTEMYVDETSGLTSVVAEAAAPTFRIENGMVTMLADGNFEAYTTDGVRIVCISAKKGETINLSAVRSAVILLKSGTYTLKTTLR